MRIATYNIHGWRTLDGEPNLQAVASTLTAAQADIIGLNEVFYLRQAEGSQLPALQALAERLDMHFVFGPCLRWPAHNDMPAEAYGNALLSRWPIAASAAHHLSQAPGKEQRGLLEGRVLMPDQRTITVYVTHLDHTDEDVRLSQLRAARSWTMRDRNRPHIVMGDFNAISPWDAEARPDIAVELRTVPDGQHMMPEETGPAVIAQMEKAGYVDAFTLFGKPGARSYVPSATPIRIDYIFASKPLAQSLRNCVIWETPGAEPSDHRPVVAEIALP